MKKLFLYLLSFIFIITSSGVMVNMHYCMGKLAGTSMSWVSNSPKKCGKCGMEKSKKKGKGCCHDSKKLIKNVFDQNIANSFFNVDHQLALLPNSSNFETVSIVVSDDTKQSNFSHAPPDQLGVPIYIADCSFLI
ncbi:MAG: hypothetical protein EBU05_04550 [Chitinophagia bacterium]|jgi:hypothetical protein|nr:hypothetical protein [Chitinophagia bacterium]